MKLRTFRPDTANRILTSLILDKDVTSQVARIWTQNGLFPNKWSNLVAGWCIDYWRDYQEAPGAVIQQIYENWVNDNEVDKDNQDMVERFLRGLSDKYESGDELPVSQYMVDKASKYFSKVKLQKLGNFLSNGASVEDCERKIQKYKSINLGAHEFLDPISEEAVDAAFQYFGDDVIEYPGPLGQFFGNKLTRESLIAFTAPEKRAKSFWLMDLAWMGLRQRRKIAFFEVGDMSKAQLMRRFMARCAKRPFRAQEVKYPINLSRENGEIQVEHETKIFRENLSKQMANKCVNKRQRLSFSKKLRISCHPTQTVNVSDIEGLISQWESASGWVPDVVLIDYADILAPPAGIRERRDQINETWMQLRRLSQELHCLVGTATQGNAKSYTAHTIGQGNFSEDKRKNAHVTCMFGINQLPDEKTRGIQRINCFDVRDGEESSVYVANCLALGRTAVKSCF
jgi:hypothetical protein